MNNIFVNLIPRDSKKPVWMTREIASRSGMIMKFADIFYDGDEEKLPLKIKVDINRDVLLYIVKYLSCLARLEKKKETAVTYYLINKGSRKYKTVYKKRNPREYEKVRGNTGNAKFMEDISEFSSVFDLFSINAYLKKTGFIVGSYYDSKLGHNISDHMGPPKIQDVLPIPKDMDITEIYDACNYLMANEFPFILLLNIIMDSHHNDTLLPDLIPALCEKSYYYTVTRVMAIFRDFGFDDGTKLVYDFVLKCVLQKASYPVQSFSWWSEDQYTGLIDTYFDKIMDGENNNFVIHYRLIESAENKEDRLLKCFFKYFENKFCSWSWNNDTELSKFQRAIACPSRIFSSKKIKGNFYHILIAALVENDRYDLIKNSKNEFLTRAFESFRTVKYTFDNASDAFIKKLLFVNLIPLKFLTEIYTKDFINNYKNPLDAKKRFYRWKTLSNYINSDDDEKFTNSLERFFRWGALLNYYEIDEDRKFVNSLKLYTYQKDRIDDELLRRRGIRKYYNMVLLYPDVHQEDEEKLKLTPRLLELMEFDHRKKIHLEFDKSIWVLKGILNLI